MRLTIWPAFPSQNTNTSNHKHINQKYESYTLCWYYDSIIVHNECLHKCVCIHTRFIWNLAQLCMHSHMNSAQMCIYSHMNLAQLCVYSHKVHLEFSTNVHVLTQGSYGTQHNCASTYTWTQHNCACIHTWT